MPLIVFILAVAFFSMHIVLTKKRMSSKHKMELLLTYLIAYLIGFEGLVEFVSHVFYPEQTATLIGLNATRSFFQFEVGIANLAFSVLGFLAIFIRKRFWLAVIIGYSIFLWGAAIGRIIELVTASDIAKNNIGIYFISDIVVPCLLIVTYFFFINSEQSSTKWLKKLQHTLNEK